MIDNKADAPTKKERFIRFGGNDDDLGAALQNVQNTSREGAENASKDANVKFSGDPSGVEEGVNKVNQMVAESTGAVNSGELGEYELNADTTGVEEGTDKASELVSGSTDEVNDGDAGEYELTADPGGVITGLAAATKSIKEAIAKTDTTFQLKATLGNLPLESAFGAVFGDEHEKASSFANLVDWGIHFIDQHRQFFGLDKGETSEVPPITDGGNDLASTLDRIMKDAIDGVGETVKDNDLLSAVYRAMQINGTHNKEGTTVEVEGDAKIEAPAVTES